MVPYALFLWMLTGSKQSDQFFLCHSDAYECMYIVAETQRNCECFEVKLSNTLCSLFYCYQQLCVFVHILDPRLSSPASIPLTYSPSLFSSGKDASCVFSCIWRGRTRFQVLLVMQWGPVAEVVTTCRIPARKGSQFCVLSIVLFLLSTLVLPVGTQIHRILCSLLADYFINMGTTATYKGRWLQGIKSGLFSIQQDMKKLLSFPFSEMWWV